MHGTLPITIIILLLNSVKITKEKVRYVDEKTKLNEQKKGQSKIKNEQKQEVS